MVEGRLNKELLETNERNMALENKVKIHEHFVLSTLMSSRCVTNTDVITLCY